jgi:hypothetical protein
MKAIGRGAPYALLLFPLLLGTAVIIWLVNSSDPVGNPEGNAIGWFFFGWGTTLFLPIMVLQIAAWALHKCRIPFPLFFVVVLLALAPVAYFLCASVPSSVPEALAGFCAVVAPLSYGLYRVVR